jgi:CheY-like chemotaxis protein
MPRLLLVEDNEMNRDMLTRRLQRKGYEVDTAVDGQEGVDKAMLEGESAPSLVLLDMDLPVLDGWEVARRLRATEHTKDLPIIALTAHAMVGDREKAIAAGCSEYDTKPVEFRRLLGKIETLLAGIDASESGE